MCAVAGVRTNSVLSALLALATLSVALGLINYDQNTPNPFQGQNLPPDGQSIDDFPVKVMALVEDLYRVDEQYYTFSIVFGLLLQYNDSQTADNVLNDDSQNCTFYCASDPTATLNNLGYPACCDRAFIPAVQAVNLIAYSGQEVPAEYQLSILSDNTVAFYSRTRGTFSTDLEYSSYPFDKHFLAADFKTTFSVVPSGVFVEVVNAEVSYDQQYPDGLPKNYADSYRPSVTAIDLPAWRVVYAHFEVMNFTTEYVKGGQNARHYTTETKLDELSGHGFRVSIEVERQREAFYIIVEVIPICLIVAFSFACFTLPIANMKARFNVLAGQFLTLIVLQFILYTVLPSTYQVIKPYILICVSYVMTFLMCGEVITANWLQTQYKRNLRKRVKKACKAAYKDWKTKVLQGKVPRQPNPAIMHKTGHSPEEGGADESFNSSDSYSFASIEDGRANGGPLEEAKTSLCERDNQRLKRWQASRLFHFRAIREPLLIWYYMGRPEAQDFCHYVARVFDKVCCLGLAGAYIVTVITLFVLAAHDANAAADYS